MQVRSLKRTSAMAPRPTVQATYSNKKPSIARPNDISHSGPPASPTSRASTIGDTIKRIPAMVVAYGP